AVDDNASSLRFLEEQLAALGCDVLGAKSGETALELLASNSERSPVALVLLDAAMPEMDGLAVAKEMRADKRFRRIPIVMMQAGGGAESPPAPRRLGLSAAVTKPVRFRHLLRALTGATGAAVDLPATGEGQRAEAASLAGLGLRVLFAEDHTVNQAVAVRMCE